jgi:DNA-binding ferritin-like protein
MHKPDKIKELRAKMIEHLESAIALADETQDSTTSYLLERALDQARADQWPQMDARCDTKRKG